MAAPAGVPLSSGDASPRPREVLFLGRQVTSHHRPDLFHAMMRLPWAERDLRMKFTVNLADLNAVTLGAHDAIFIYGNAFSGELTAGQQVAFQQYANGGGGVAAMHVACWSSPDAALITSVIGGAFLGHHAIQEFSQVILPVEHPILKGLGTYTSVDEPYLFKNVMPDRTILTMRNGPVAPEAMTWVRQQGLGRVFYHSGGHDSRTWVQPNFQELVTRGIEWVARAGDGPAVAGIDRARIGNGGAIAVRATLAGAPARDAVFTLQGGEWHRPVLEGDAPYDQGSGAHVLEPADPLRVGGAAAQPVTAMISKFTDAGAVERWGLWTGRGGLVRTTGQEEGWISWGEGYLVLAAPPVGTAEELVMNAAGTAAARVYVAREGFPLLDTALVRAVPGAAEPAVLLVEGEDPGLAGGAWTCGDLADCRLSLNGPGHLAARVSGVSGERVLLDSGSGWSGLLATGESAPGLAAGTTVNDLRDVRLNDAGSVMVTAAIDPGGSAILRRPAGAGDWTAVVTDGPQPWLAAGESLVLPADGKGSLIDSGSQVWSLATILHGGGSSPCLLRIPAAGTVDVICRVGGALEWGGESLTVTALGGPDDWSCGPAGIACGKITVAPASGPAREVLVRWNGRHALPVMEAGRVFHGAAGDFTVAGIRVDGGGTAEDGKGGYLTSGGEWVAVATAAGGGDRLIHGSSLADLDGDGRDDLLEDALGGNPALPDGTPLLGIEPVAAGAVLRFLKRTSGPFAYGIEASGDLAAWQLLAAEPQLAADQSGVPAGFQRMELAVSGQNGFVRLRVSAD